MYNLCFYFILFVQTNHLFSMSSSSTTFHSSESLLSSEEMMDQFTNVLSQYLSQIDTFARSSLSHFYVYWFMMQFSEETQRQIIDTLTKKIHQSPLDAKKYLSSLLTSLDDSLSFNWKDHAFLNSTTGYKEWKWMEESKEIEHFKQEYPDLYANNICFRRKFVVADIESLYHPHSRNNYVPYKQAREHINALYSFLHHLHHLNQPNTTLDMYTVNLVAQELGPGGYYSAANVGCYVVHRKTQDPNFIRTEILNKNASRWIMMEHELDMSAKNTPNSHQRETFRVLGFLDIDGYIRFVVDGQEEVDLMNRLLYHRTKPIESSLLTSSDVMSLILPFLPTKSDISSLMQSDPSIEKAVSKALTYKTVSKNLIPEIHSIFNSKDIDDYINTLHKPLHNVTHIVFEVPRKPQNYSIYEEDDPVRLYNQDDVNRLLSHLNPIVTEITVYTKHISIALAPSHVQKLNIVSIQNIKNKHKQIALSAKTLVLLQEYDEGLKDLYLEDSEVTSLKVYQHPRINLRNFIVLQNTKVTHLKFVTTEYMSPDKLSLIGTPVEVLEINCPEIGEVELQETNVKKVIVHNKITGDRFNWQLQNTNVETLQFTTIFNAPLNTWNLQNTTVRKLSFLFLEADITQLNLRQTNVNDIELFGYDHSVEKWNLEDTHVNKITFLSLYNYSIANWNVSRVPHLTLIFEYEDERNEIDTFKQKQPHVNIIIVHPNQTE